MDNNINYLERMKKGEKLENELVKNNMGLVLSIVHKFTYSGVEFEDLSQIGTIGLIKAIRNFDTERGVMFSTYAVPVIIGEIKKYLRDNGAIKVSRSIREQYMKLQRIRNIFIRNHEREPTIKELADISEIPYEDIPLALDAGSRPISFEEPIGDDSNLTLADTVKDDKVDEMENLSLREGLSSLLPDERRLISLRYFLNKTQQETANLLGMTQVQVSRKEKKIIEKIRDKLA